MRTAHPSLLLAAGLVLALAVVLVAFPAICRDPKGDFVEYWAAGRLNLARDDPYSPSRVLATEREVGWPLSYPMMMWNPPWTLTYVMPLGAMPFPTARGVWLVVQLAIALGCAVALWRHYGGPAGAEPAAVVLAALFAPLLLSLKYGQIGPLVLLGVTGFLVAQARRRDFLAGAFLALAAVKPHLVYAVWPAVLVWAAAAGRWRVIAGGLTAGAVTAAIPAVVNPDVYRQFLEITANPPPSSDEFRSLRDWGSPTFGWHLRRLFGQEHFRLQYLPPLLGLGWLTWYGWRHRRAWDWSARLPELLLVSVSTAAYGAWAADSLVLLPAVVAAAARVSGDPRRVRVGFAWLVVLTLATLAIETGPNTEMYVWVPPLYGLGYWWATRFTGLGAKEERAEPAAPVG